jgi:dihydroorotate dehydrogenase electron transfer subunit
LLPGCLDFAILIRTNSGNIMRKDPQARILRKQNWDDYFLLTLESPKIAALAQPGQFLMVRCSDSSYPLLRRPFSIHYAEKDNLEIFFQVAGAGTTLLSQKRQDEKVDILGPLGNGFSVSPSSRPTSAALIGGGRGIAPLFFLAKALQREGIDPRVYYGGKTEKDLPLRERFQSRGFPLRCATEDGSYGCSGLITDCLTQELETQPVDRIFACGPDGMLERLAQISRELTIPAELSLEAIMGCGFGACWGCVQRIKKEGETGWHKICEDGPVFPAEAIVWGKD